MPHVLQAPTRFLALPVLVPAQFPGHEVDDAWDGLQRGVFVEEGEAGAAGDDVVSVQRPLVPRGVDDLFRNNVTTTNQ
jgi:hypothetical protein